MQINEVLDIALPVVLIAIGIALVVLIVELIKIVKVARHTLADTKTHLDPMLANVEEMTASVKPAIAKAEPLVDRVQLTLDSVNLEMMRVDEILEDVSQITDSASSATAAVDKISNAPVKAVSNVATRVRSALGAKNASDESIQIAEGADAPSVSQALEDFREAEAADAAEAAVKDAGLKDEAAPAPEPVQAAEPEPGEPAASDAAPSASALDDLETARITPAVAIEGPAIDISAGE